MVLKEKMNTVEMKDFNGMSHSRQFQFHEMMKELQPKKQEGEGYQKSGQLPDSLQKFVVNKMNKEERIDFAGMTKSNQLRFHEQIKEVESSKRFSSSAGSSLPGSVYITAQEVIFIVYTKIRNILNSIYANLFLKKAAKMDLSFA
jgi:hypothetical protein